MCIAHCFTAGRVQWYAMACSFRGIFRISLLRLDLDGNKCTRDFLPGPIDVVVWYLARAPTGGTGWTILTLLATSLSHRWMCRQIGTETIQMYNNIFAHPCSIFSCYPAHSTVNRIAHYYVVCSIVLTSNSLWHTQNNRTEPNWTDWQQSIIAFEVEI